MCDFFRSVIALTPADLLPCVYLCCNKIAPAYEGRELGIGDALLFKVVSHSNAAFTIPVSQLCICHLFIYNSVWRSRVAQVKLWLVHCC
jgi:hypothetical protein